MKKQIPIFIVFLTGIIMVIQYFVPHGFSEFIFTYANDFVIAFHRPWASTGGRI